jgi:multidrug efflux pump subunit AcrA (membrane-fusion protein)
MSKKMKRLLIWIGVILVVGLGIGAFVNNAQKNARQALIDSTEVVTVERGDLTLYTLAKGKIVSAKTTEYGFTGSFNTSYVSVGDVVNAKDDLGKYVNLMGQTRVVETKVDGIVIAVPGSFSTTWVIADPNDLQMSVQISEKDIAKIEIGQSAQIFVDALAITVEGTVSDISFFGNTTADYTTYTVILNFSKGEFPIFLGMTGSGKIQISALNDVLLVPVDALIEEDGKYYLLDEAWLETPSRPQREFYVEVTLGAADIRFAEVSAAGLEGQAVLILPSETTFGFFGRFNND